MSSFLRGLYPSNFFRRSSIRPTLLTIGTLATWFPMYLFFNDHIAQLMWVTGPSMYPFLNTDYNSTTRKDVVFVNMRNPSEGLMRGMIVAFWSPYRPENMIVKRVIALEGDQVRTRAPYPFPRETIPEGHVWVEGEHPEDRMSLDSNTYGPISKSLIAGKITGVVWPFSKAGSIRWQDYRGNPRVVEGQPNLEAQQFYV
ncbi:hypothetical protein MMC24_007810 [Lignoscripta atroalba]|nr:hypothetical protein [Lignoscripta atroalba]